MVSVENEFFNKIKELFDLYEKVKLAIIYAENFDPKQEFYLAPSNQLRSSLDHIFKAAAHPSDLEYELKEAKEHLDRAGYDAFEVLASNLGLSLVEKLNGYSTETLTNVFPDYYQIIKPKLIEIKAKLGEIRKRKKDSSLGSGDSFSSYFDQIEVLLGFNKTVDTMIPSLEEYHQKKLKEKLKERFFNVVVVGILSAVIGGLIVFFISTYVQQSHSKVSTPEIKSSKK
jgi:hypothetical protein